MITAKMTSNRSTDISQIHFQEITKMAFVVERIPEEAIRGFLSEHRVYNGKAAPLSSKWVVDHKADAAMALVGSVGGSYEGTQQTDYYSLYWNGEQIRLAADLRPMTYSESGGSEVNWQVHDIDIPDGLRGCRGEIRELICEAFQAVGTSFNGSRYSTVNIQFADDVAK